MPGRVSDVAGIAGAPSETQMPAASAGAGASRPVKHFPRLLNDSRRPVKNFHRLLNDDRRSVKNFSRLLNDKRRCSEAK